jgi:hypothetical protein
MGEYAEARDGTSRKADTLAKLSTPEIDAWVASSSPDGAAHLVPLSMAWAQERIIIAVDSTSRTSRDIQGTGRCRVGVGPTRDVVMVDAVLEAAVPVEEAGDLGETYAAQADWDPRGSSGYVYLVLRPTRIQAWREVNEIPGRTIMREGRWLY